MTNTKLSLQCEYIGTPIVTAQVGSRPSHTQVSSYLGSREQNERLGKTIDRARFLNFLLFTFLPRSAFLTFCLVYPDDLSNALVLYNLSLCQNTRLWNERLDHIAPRHRKYAFLLLIQLCNSIYPASLRVPHSPQLTGLVFVGTHHGCLQKG